MPGLRRGIPDSTVTSIEVGPGEPTAPDDARHRVRRWRDALSVDGWGWPSVRRWPGIAWRSTAAWSQRPSGRLAVPALMILALIGATGAAGLYLVPSSANPTTAAQPATPSAGAALPTDVPPTFAVPTFAPPTGGPIFAGGRPADALAGWAQQISTRTQIPPAALQAYGYAEWVLSQQQPNCRLNWPTLAAIGKVESNHGSANAATLTADGHAFPPIYGPVLDGQGGRQLIRDTDGGSLDQDTTYDRAIGPMQFIPQTWQTYPVDADDDGIRDAQDIDDSALAAARYLCSGGRNMAVTDSWLQAILSYNNLGAYVDAVHTAANDYGQRSRTTP